MHRRSFLTLITLTAAGLSRGEDATWQSLFDGRTLTGWRPTAKSHHSAASGNKTGGNWRVEDGAICGSQDTPGNGGLLITEAEYGDFEIALETNCDFGPDSGLFMRCTEDGKAYQCLIDYHPGGTIGGILGEGIWKRRGERNFTFGKTPELITLNENKDHPCPVLPESWKYFWRTDQWNEVRARITGDPPAITTWVNGVQIMQYTEPQSMHPAKGHIGLQLHGGKIYAGTVRFRNIRLRAL